MAELSPRLGGTAIADELTEDRWLGGRLTLVQPRRGHRVGTDAALLVAAAGTPAGPDRRRWRGSRRGRAGAGQALSARVRRSRRDRSRAGAARREQRGAQRASGAHARPAGSTRSIGASAGRPGFSTRRPSASSPTRRSSRPRRFAPLPTKAERARMSCRARRPARRSPTGFPGLARDSRARRAVRDDPPARRAWRDPRRDRRAAWRAGAAAGSSDERRERASSAGLGREGLQGPAAHCAGADPAWGRRAADGRGGRASIAASGSSTGASRLLRGREIVRMDAVCGFARDSVFSAA